MRAVHVPISGFRLATQPPTWKAAGSMAMLKLMLQPRRCQDMPAMGWVGRWMAGWIGRAYDRDLGAGKEEVEDKSG